MAVYGRHRFVKWRTEHLSHKAVNTVREEGLVSQCTTGQGTALRRFPVNAVVRAYAESMSTVHRDDLPSVVTLITSACEERCVQSHCHFIDFVMLVHVKL